MPSKNNSSSPSSSSSPPLFSPIDATGKIASLVDDSFTVTSPQCASSSAAVVKNNFDGNDDRTTNNRIACNNGIIQLNVGGIMYTTSFSTLTRIPGSFFESMFSGRHTAATITRIDASTVGHAEVRAPIPSPASYFIDRDGKHFRHILNYLRCGTVVSLPPDDIGKEELAIEADFYGLDELLLAIQRPPLDVNEHLPNYILNIQEEERKLRSKFVEGVFAAAGGANRSAPYVGLISLFAADDVCNDDGFEGTPVAPKCPLRYDAIHPLCQDPSCVFLSTLGNNMKSNDDERTKEPQSVTVATLDEFIKNFNNMHFKVLRRIQNILQTENVIIAGGSVLHALTANSNIRTGGGMWGKKGDIDIFFYGMSSKEEANELVRRLFLALAEDNDRWVILRCRGVINIHNDDTKIQIILRLYDKPAEILIGFDVDCCACCFTGDDVKITKRCYSSLVSGINVLNPLHAWPKKASYELRLGKYAARGFAVYVPGLPKNRIGYSEQIQKSKLEDLKGIARFIKVDIEMNTACPIYFWHIPWTGQAGIRPPPPRYIKSLRDSVVDDLTPSELVMDCLRSIYGEDGLGDVLVPAIYGYTSSWLSDAISQGPPEQWQWFQHEFTFSSITRDGAIETILDCTNQDNVPECIPHKLEDAWILEKRSREYLNDLMEKVDVDTIYYSPIYDYGKRKYE